MTADELKRVIRGWQLNAAQAAKVLCIHTSKMSEYLDGVSRIPCSMTFHIDALNQIPEARRKQMFQQRIDRKSHEQLTGVKKRGDHSPRYRPE